MCELPRFLQGPRTIREIEMKTNPKQQPPCPWSPQGDGPNCGLSLSQGRGREAGHTGRPEVGGHCSGRKAAAGEEGRRVGVTSRPASQVPTDDTLHPRKEAALSATHSWAASRRRCKAAPPSAGSPRGGPGRWGCTAGRGPGPALELSPWAGLRRRRRSWRPGLSQLDLLTRRHAHPGPSQALVPPHTPTPSSAQQLPKAQWVPLTGPG